MVSGPARPAPQVRALVAKKILGEPLVYALSKSFLSQDQRVAKRQSEGLAYDPALILIDDANTQIKWHARLKREWLESQAAGRPFENPLKPATLRWRS